MHARWGLGQCYNQKIQKKVRGECPGLFSPGFPDQIQSVNFFLTCVSGHENRILAVFCLSPLSEAPFFSLHSESWSRWGFPLRKTNRYALKNFKVTKKKRVGRDRFIHWSLAISHQSLVNKLSDISHSPRCSHQSSVITHQVSFISYLSHPPQTSVLSSVSPVVSHLSADARRVGPSWSRKRKFQISLHSIKIESLGCFSIANSKCFSVQQREDFKISRFDHKTGSCFSLFR